ncbi:MAG: hypothetical protein JXR89_11710 [Deltaproteobacteria bacterium]|nr:hypothetical protein [Deltaproteobacteria bacterium]
MGELVKRGHLYIAQPPLYRVTRGKHHEYLSTERELNEFIIRHNCDEVEVLAEAGGFCLQGEELVQTLLRLISYKYHLDRLWSKGYPAPLVKKIIKVGIRERADLTDDKKLMDLKEKLPNIGFRCEEITLDQGNDTSGMIVRDDRDQTFAVDYGLVKSGDFQALRKLTSELLALDDPPFQLKVKDETESVASKEELLNRVLEKGRGGINIQRYKGLGEMNPEQLWETTMDPEKRKLLQVTVEDDVEADDIFTVLMGDNIISRRAFIEENALQVANLDV